MRHFKLLFALFFVIILSCKDQGKKELPPNSIGAINTMIVVMDNELWKSKVGDKVREHFAASSLGLTLDEPLFSIIQVPPAVFSGTVRNTRAVLFVQKDTLSLAHIKSDLYSKPQKVAVVKGTTEDELIENLDNKAKEIISTFKDLEIGEAQNRFQRSLNKEKDIQEKFGINLSIPSIYKVVKSEENLFGSKGLSKGTNEYYCL